MSIKLELPPRLEKFLKHRAEKLGKPVDELIMDILNEEIDQEGETSEELLMQKASLGIAPERWERYYHLIKLRDSQKLTEKEHNELISISNEIEERNARRMPYVFRLAALKRRSAKSIIAEMGLK